MSKTRHGAVTTLVTGLVTSVALLSGCGAAQPGVAAQVGDETISLERIDDLAGDYCLAVEKQLQGNAQRVPQRYFRAGIVGSLAMRSVAEQLADDYGVEAGSTYDQQVSELEQSVAVLPEEVQEAVVEVESSKTYVEAIQAAIGEQALAEEEVADATYDQQVARGQGAFEDWISENGVEFDPSLGIKIVKGRIESADTALSFPVSDNASYGAAPEPNAEYAANLPDSHRCG